MSIVKFTACAVLLLAAGWWIVPTAQLPQRSTGYVDLHVHTAGLGFGSEAFINDAMRNSYRFPFYLAAFGTSEAELAAEGDAVLFGRIARAVRDSQRVERAVVLAMDGVLNDEGNLDRERTQIYMPNEFVATHTARYPELLFGASVNPYRRDAIARLRWAKAHGAVLIKWIPNIMQIDPADPVLEPFYREMIALALPLLSHTGQERSFAGADDTLGDPRKLALPLRLGVRVIAAHIATTGENDGEENYERILPMFSRYPNLYTEISSLTQVNKRNYLVDALTRVDLQDRLLFGTDWPLQFPLLTSPLYQFDQLDIGTMKAILDIDNQWDRDVALKEALGVPEAVFERSKKLVPGINL